MRVGEAGREGKRERYEKLPCLAFLRCYSVLVRRIEDRDTTYAAELRHIFPYIMGDNPWAGGRKRPSSVTGKVPQDSRIY